MGQLSDAVEKRVAKLFHKELFPGLPDPIADVDSLYRTVSSLKQGYEQLVRTRGVTGKSALLVQELDIVLEVLQGILDERYVTTEDVTAAEGTLEGLNQLLNLLNAHVANMDVHFTDAPDGQTYLRSDGKWVLFTAGSSWSDLIDDATTAYDKTWSSQKISSELAGKLSAVSEDTAPSLGGFLDLDGQGFTANLIAGAALSAGDICYLNSSGKMALADATADTTSNTLMAIATASMALDETGVFLLRGFYTLSGLTPGSILYASTTAGGWTHTAPSAVGQIVRVLGYAVTSSQVFFIPGDTWIKRG